ncbi:unnamed protein product [Didymodactylos carnosus]|uniref:Uncharacterized protein n=1 Tax=Didymodactylos carnosus TaxID=1234261 RepID=A0A8S2F6E4_9BILA|nr:unnamed protein product [Didymodactylos carnosus]CAF4173013.1 unnamed protein product [Didymodactylos carnosus]
MTAMDDSSQIQNKLSNETMTVSSNKDFGKYYGTDANNKRLKRYISSAQFSQNQSSMTTAVTGSANSQRKSQSQKFDFPPFIVKFKEDQQEMTDRKLIDELIRVWKNQHNKDINITGRFGHNQWLLIFANEPQTFEDLLNEQSWPDKLNNSEILIKQPRQLPSSYSLVIQQFHKNWKEKEVLEELKLQYLSLKNLTRMFTKDETSMNIVRADFSSLKEVQDLLAIGLISIGHLKHKVKQYYAPIRIQKCMKCFSHAHTTNNCRQSHQMCIRCGQQHAFNNECNNEIKCINCHGEHYAGHSSCPEVQKIRKEIREKYKTKRAELMVRFEQQQQDHNYGYDDQDFPPLNTVSSIMPPIPCLAKYSAVIRQQQQPQQTPITTNYESKSIENILNSFMNKIDARIQQMETTVMTQLCDIEIKIDKQQTITNTLEEIIYDIILPGTKLVQDVAFQMTRHAPTKQQLGDWNNEITKLLYKRQQSQTITANGRRNTGSTSLVSRTSTMNPNGTG